MFEARIQMKYLCLILWATSVAARFTDDFYRLLAKDNAKKNLVTSPLSVEIGMSMAYMGAEGTTAQELRSTLKLAEDKREVAKKYGKLLANLQGREKDVILELANRIYVNEKYSLVPEYNQIVRDSFKAEAVPISTTDANTAAAIVNKWVTDQTRGKITEIITPGDIDSDLRAVLLNVIYFKGQWKYKFLSTEKRTFRVSNEESIPVQMMSLYTTKCNADELEDLDAKVLELPFRNSSLVMQIFLPNKVDGLSELEDKIIGFSGRLYGRDVQVNLPKFKIEFTEELTDSLEKLGIRDAFSKSANFQGLVVNSKIFIKSVLHKAFIEVNEEGSEASAVTEIIGIVPLSMPLPRIDFNADHPFAYIIRDEKNIYFQGHVVRP